MGESWRDLAGLLTDVGDHDGQRLEFQRAVGDDLQDTLVAMANASGGRVVVGVTDSLPRRLVGSRSEQDVRERVAALAGATHPPLEVRTDVHRVGRAHVAVVTVPAVAAGFAQTGDGRTLLRSGRTNRALLGGDLVTFVTEAAGQPVEDAVVSSATTADLDLPSVLEHLRRRRGGPVEASEVGPLLTEQGLVVSRRPTLAALLVLGQQPQRFHRGLGIVVTRHAGPRGDAEVRETREFPGRLPDAVVAAARMIAEVAPGYPAAAVRELLLNAVVHRDYARTGEPVTVRVHADALEVESPGTLPVGVDLAAPGGAQHDRNRRIAGLFRDLGLTAGAGTGLATARAALADVLLQPPVVEQRGGSVVVRVPAASAAGVEERAWLAGLRDVPDGMPARLALLLARRGGEVTNESLRTAADASATDSRRVLRLLVAGGLLRVVGERRPTRYALADELREQPPPLP
ncbi:ATP-binding protein [Kineococcus rubinsiae]|uniref:ATP-binding protein n=1 Tax=Kineococcus rubinsiae TaxID=2609562 RepID=UPI0014304D4D|nr:ATP-binding protein [Kineococcus rubinsiae]